MAVTNSPVTATTTGYSDSLKLPPGDHMLTAYSSAWGNATLEVSLDGSTWFSAKDESGAITLTANCAYRALGGVQYRLNVASISANIVLSAQKVAA